MDGVLVNNTRAHVRAFEIFCKRYGVEEWQRKLQTSFGMGNDDIMRQILPEEIIREKGLKALGEEKEAIYREVYAPEIRPVRGLVDLLEELRRRGIPCAVGSSGCRENVDFVLGNCGIADYFSCIVSGDRVTRCKPDPEIYLLAAEGLHLLPADCLVFEDARAGITAAYTGETLAGLENLTACESLRIGSAAHPNETLRQLSLPALKEIKGDLCVYGTALQTADFKSLQSVAGHFVLQSDALLQLTADELTTVAGNMTLIGTTADEAKAPCEQMYFPKLQRIDGTLTLSRFDRLSGLGTTFGVLTQAGALRYEHLALANTFEFPLIETTGNITVTDCPILRSVLLPALTDAGSLEITGCPAIETLSFPKAERFDGDVSLATLPAIKDFGEFLPALKAISGDLSIDDLSSLEGVLDLSGCTFSPNSTLDLRLVAATRLTELRGGDFGGSLRIDASSLTPQPEAMPFEITGFKSLDTLRIAGFTHISALSLPTESCDDLTIENCGSQAPFTLSLPNLVEVRGTLLCRNCGKAGEANSASFPRLRNIGRQLSFYVGASSFTALEFPLLETIGNGEPVSDDPADDYALYTMPSGCAGEFILPSLQRVNGSMLVSTWNTSTDRAVAFRFPSLQSVAGEISVGHTAYKNRSVATLDFSALTAAGAIRIGNLSSVTDFSTFTQVLPRLSEQTWSVTDCGYNPTYQQMLDGETGAESK